MEASGKTNKPPKRPDAARIRGQLLEGNFGLPNDGADLPVPDPISITQLVLALKDIRAYDKNPRRLTNPQYGNIKASIRSQRGLNNPFNVTRRPGDPHYMVQSGGNTRLAILYELYAETGDEALNTVPCLFVPWTTESAVLAAHLVENELRGEMALIDKAYAIQELRSQLEQSKGALSDRAFVRAVTDLGFKLSPRKVGRLAYALELDRLIPMALRDGVGYRQLDTIRNTEKAYLQYCQGKTDRMPVLFAQHMASHDGDGFDVEGVRQAIDADLSGILNVSCQRLSLDIDAVLFEVTHQHQADALWADTEEGDFADAQALQPEARHAQDYGAPDKQKRPAQPKFPKGTATVPQRGFALAMGIAESVGRTDWVLQGAEGLGFTIREPETPWTNVTERSVWSLLSGLSGHAPPIQSLEIQDAAAAFQVLTDPALVSDPVFNRLANLMALCRSAKKQPHVGLVRPEPFNSTTGP